MAELRPTPVKSEEQAGQPVESGERPSQCSDGERPTRTLPDQAASPPAPAAGAIEANIPISAAPLNDVLSELEEYTPVIPDAVAAYYLQRAGFQAEDPRISRVIALAAQKFVSDVASDALQNYRFRMQATGRKPSKSKHHTLTMEDLTPALEEHGITVRKPPFYPS